MVFTGVAMKLARAAATSSMQGSCGRSLLVSSLSSYNLLEKHRKIRKTTLLCDQEPHLSSLLSGIRLNMVPNNKGVGGTYFIQDGDQPPAAVFKPNDEEAVPDEEASNDLFVGKEIKPGLLHGEGYLKEVAAYLLDKEKGFHGVPPTVLIGVDSLSSSSSSITKVGSLQQYVSHTCTAEDMGWSSFPVEEVHKIGILDCRLLNTDRNLGNILVVKDGASVRLVPIDHGLCLPSDLSGAYFEWLSFPQCKKPFSPQILEYIENIDIEQDIQLLQKNLPSLRKECLDTLRICTVFLKKCAKAGLTLFEIGCLMSRYNDMDSPCLLETITSEVIKRASEEEESVPDSAARESIFWEIFNEETDKAICKHSVH